MKKRNLIFIISLLTSGCGSLLTYKEPLIKNENAKKIMIKAGDYFLKEGDYLRAAEKYKTANELKKLEEAVFLLNFKSTYPQDTINEFYNYLEKHHYKIRPPEEIKKELKKKGFLK